MSEAVLKQNSGFFMRPYGFFQAVDGGRVRRAETVVAGQIYSMSKGENVCRYGYSAFMAKNNMAKSTVARSIKNLDRDGKIFRTRHGGKTSEYAYTVEQAKPGHIRTENFFYTEKFVVDGKERCLTFAEIDVYALIYTATRNEKSGKFEGSAKIISEILGMSKMTARRALTVLLALGLIYRPTKGVNCHDKSVFVANMKWIRSKERACKKEEKKAQQAYIPPEVLAADARAARDKFYAERRQAAEARADKYIQRAESNSEYKAVSKELRGLDIKVARAEVYQTGELPALLKKGAVLKARRNELLSMMGLKLWQFNPKAHCACRKCFDTGFVSDGRACDCYMPTS